MKQDHLFSHSIQIQQAKDLKLNSWLLYYTKTVFSLKKGGRGDRLVFTGMMKKEILNIK